MTQTRWLSAEEQRSWRAWLTASALLTEQLEHDLKDARGLSMAEYEVLVRLSEAPNRHLRMSDLASKTLSSRSRLSHQIARMEAAGLVRREDCAEDRRGAWAVLTDAGFARLVEAAPDHVESVRRHLVDVLSPREFAQLGELCQQVADRLQVTQTDPDDARPGPRPRGQAPGRGHPGIS